MTLRAVCEAQPDRWLGRRYAERGDAALASYGRLQMAWSEAMSSYCQINGKTCIDTYRLGIEKASEIACSTILEAIAKTERQTEN